jgi:YD repeat-containing protein
MTAIISNNNLGLAASSLNGAGGFNVGGFGQPGNSGESMYVNIATGNLIVQRQDEILKARGLDVSALLTYNSQGVLDGDNNDNWRIGFYRQIKSLVGVINTVGSTVNRVDADGAELVYNYDSATKQYVTTGGDGSYHTLRYDANTNQWAWTDGSSRVTETYGWVNGIGSLSKQKDTAGNTINYVYEANGLLKQVLNPGGESIYLDYTGINLTQLRTLRNDGSTSTRVLYSYSTSNRLTRVTVDLSPDDNSISDGKTYFSDYTYDGASRRIATLTQSDGTSLSFLYDASDRVINIKDALGNQCSYAYDTANRITTVTDALGQQSTWRYDAQGQLLQTTSPDGNGGTASRSYSYSAKGDLIQITDELGRHTVMQYDANGNQTLQRDHLGNTITRTFDSNNQLLAETAYLVPDPDGADPIHKNTLGAPATPLITRYVYDAAGKSQLRFIISPEGRVTEYRYDGNGQRIASIDHASTQYASTKVLESDLATWVASTAVDKTRSLRTDYAWDFRGQLSSSTVWASVDSTGNGVAGTGATTIYVYDARGLLLSSIAPLGGASQTTSYVYDGLGRVLSVANGLGQLTSTSYSSAANKVTVTAANGLVTTSTFDAAGRLVNLQKTYLMPSETTGSLVQVTSTERYYYDKGDRLRMMEDATGVRTWLLYDDANRKVGEIDGNGSLSEFIYNAAGQLTRTIRYATAASTAGLTLNADGSPTASALALRLSDLRPAANASQDQSAWNAYDNAGRLVKTVDAAGGVTEIQYDGASRIVKVTVCANRIATTGLNNQPAAASITPSANASADQVTRNFYDNDGLLRATLDAEGYLVEILYDAAGRETRRIGYATPTNTSSRAAGTLTDLRPASNANDIRSWRFYDDRSQLVAEIDGENHLTEYQYDANGNQRTRTRYANYVTAAISVSAELATLRPIANSADQVQSWTYDALNRIASETDFEGTQATYTYDNGGNLTQVVRAAGTSEARTSTTTYNQAGQISAETNGRNKTISYTLDLAGRRISETDANGNRTLYYYDADEQLVYTINALGEVSANVYNTLHQRTAEIRYGTRLAAGTLATLTGGLVNSSVQSVVSALAKAAVDSRTSYAYNPDGRLASSTDALGKVTSYQYDAFGNRTGVTTAIDAGSRLQQTFGYDRRNLQTSMQEDPAALDISTSMEYDAFGRVISQTDALGKVSQQSYDRLGRVVQIRDRLNQVQASTYDAFDRVLTQADSLGSVTSYSYNTATRSVSIRTPEGITVTSARNRHGQTQTVTDGRGNVTTYVYDANGNLVQTTSPAGQVSTQRYDDADRLIESTDANGVKTAISYDAANRVLSRIVDPNAAGYTGLNLVSSYVWDPKGQQIRSTDPSGIATEIEYDLNGQVTRRTVDSGTGRLNLSTVYSYDDRGKTLTVTDAAGGVTQYFYDKLGRRNQERVDPTGLNLVTRYYYDANDNVVAKTDANGNQIRYAYDDEDRLRFEVDALGQVSETVYDGEGRVVRTIGYANPISLAGLGTTVSIAGITARLTSDASRDTSESKVYDRDGRLSFSIDGIGAVKKYDYDANGNVIRQTAYANLPVASVDIAKQFAATADQESFALRSTVTFNVAVAGTYTFFTTSDDGSRLYIDGEEVINNDSLQATTRLITSVTLTAGTHTLVQTYFDYNSANSNNFGIASGPTGTSEVNNFGVSFGLMNVEVFNFSGDYVSLNTAGTVNLGLTDTAAGVALTLVGRVSAIATDVMQMGRVVIADATRDQVTSRIYDAANRLQYTVDGTGAVKKYDYDANGNVVCETSYANRLRPASIAALPADTNAMAALVTPSTVWDRVTSYQYDLQGRMTRSTLAPVGVYAVETTSQLVSNGASNLAARVETQLSLHTENYYDAFGNIVASRDAAGNLRYRAYDSKGQATIEVDAEGYVTCYDYDAFGNVIALTRHACKIDDAIRNGWNPQAAPSRAALLALRVTNPADRTIISYYNARNQLTEVIQPEVFAYDGRAARMASPTVRYIYNAFGQREQSRTQKVDGGWLDSYSYFDKAGRETATVDAGNYLTERHYDAFGNMIEIIEYAGPVNALSPISYGPPAELAEDRRTLFDYDSENRKISETRMRVKYNTDSNATETTHNPTNFYTYDGFGNQVSMRDAADNTTRTYYDHANRVRAVIQAPRGIEGNANFYGLTEFVRDVFGNISQKVDRANGAGNITLSSYSTSDSTYDRSDYVWYDRWGRMIQSQDARGNSQYYSYDSNGNLAKQWSAVSGNDNGATRTVFKVFQYDKLGQLTHTIDPASANGQIINTQMRYTAFGELSGRGIVGVGTGTDIGWSEYFDFDNNGRVWRSNSGDGVNKVMLYDLQGNLTAEIRSASTNLREQSNAAVVHGLDQTRRIDNTYDALGHLLQQQQAARVVSGSSQHPLVNRTYDRWGNVLSITDPGNVNWRTDYVYNASNQLIRETKPQAQLGITFSNQRPVTEYYYDYAGNQVAVRDALGNINGKIYDSAGNVKEERNADGGVIRHVYNAFGDEVQRTDAMGKVTRYEYNKLGQMERIIRPEADFYSVDDRVFDNTAMPVVGYLDWDQTGPQYLYWAGVHTYDKLGNTLRYTRSVEVKSGYKARFDDNDSDPPSIHTSSGNLSGDNLWGVNNDVYYLRVESTNTSDPVLLQNTTSSSIQMGYNQRGQKLYTENSGGQRTNYTYDLRGNIVQTVQLGVLTSNAYDYLDRKIRETDANGNISVWEYDYFGRLKSKNTLGKVSTTYEYDAAGQIESETRSNGVEGDSYSVTYTYDGAGQTTQISSSYNWGIEREIAGIDQRTATYTYDLAGRRIFEQFVYSNTSQATTTSTTYQNQSISYNALGQVISVNINGDGTIEYRYDQVGNRIYQRENITANTSSGPRESFFVYDAMNRQILVDGVSNISVDPISNLTNDRGMIIDYDYNGNRIKEISGSGGRKQNDYEYDALNRLVRTERYSASRENRGFNRLLTKTLDYRYDQMDRMIASTLDENDPDGRSKWQLSRFDSNGRLNAKAIVLGSTFGYGTESLVYNDEYDEVGNLITSTSFGTGYYNTTVYTNDRFADGYKQTKIETIQITRNADQWDSSRTGLVERKGTSSLIYDFNGFLKSIDDENGNKDQDFVSDINGLILQKTQNNTITKNLIVNGTVLGNYQVGAGSIDFGQAQELDWSAAAGSQNSYRVNAGDTLRSIALSVYGDAQLWYLIADANGVNDGSLRVGQMLVLPKQLGRIHNDVNTFTPYSAARIIGDTNPTVPMPTPTQPSACHQTGIIIAAIIASVAITILAAALTTVTLGAAGVPAFSATGILISMIMGAAGGAAASMANQGVMIAGGLQRQMNWTEVGIGAATGLFTTGISSGAGALVKNVVKGTSLAAKILNTSVSSVKAAQGAVSTANAVALLAAKVGATGAAYAALNVANEAIGQGIRIAAKEQAIFDWKTVAAAAISGAVGGVGGMIGENGNFRSVLGGMAGDLVGSASGNLINNNGVFDSMQFAQDATSSLSNAAMGRLAFHRSAKAVKAANKDNMPTQNLKFNAVMESAIAHEAEPVMIKKEKLINHADLEETNVPLKTQKDGYFYAPFKSKDMVNMAVGHNMGRLANNKLGYSLIAQDQTHANYFEKVRRGICQ